MTANLSPPQTIRLDRAGLRHTTVRFLRRIGFRPGNRIWLRISWDLPTQLIPPKWASYQKGDKQIYQHYVFCGKVTKRGFTLCACLHNGRDAAGNTCWKVSRRRYRDGWKVAFKFSWLGATVCFYPNQPEQGISNDHVNHCNCLFYEIDDQPLTEQQLALECLKDQTGLYPAAIAYTGGKSLHVYIRCQQPLTSEQWLRLNRKLTILQNADPAICNPARSMRLAGMVRRKVVDGKLGPPIPITLEEESDRRYSSEQLETALDVTGLFPYGLPEQRWRKWVRLMRRSKTDETVDPLSALLDPPTLPSRSLQHLKRSGQVGCNPQPIKLHWRRGSGAAIPLFICLTHDDQHLLQWGEGEGNRNNAGYKLARNLLGTANLLDKEGIAYYPDPQRLFQRYCDRCTPPLDLDEADAIWQSANKTPAYASRSLDSIALSIQHWQILNQPRKPRKKPLRRDYQQ